MPSHSAASTSARTRPVARASSLAKHAPLSREHLDHLGHRPAGRHRRRRLAAVRGEQPRQVGAEHERHRGGAGGAGEASIRIVRRRGSEPQPGDLPLVAEAVEPGGLVVAHSAGQDLRLPGPDRGLVALQLPDDPSQPVDAAVLGRAGDVLPLRQEAHELLGGDRFDPPASLGARVGVDAGEEATARPLDRGRVVSGVDRPLAEAPLDGEALRLEGGESDGDTAGWQAGAPDQRSVRQRGGHLQVAAEHLGRRLLGGAAVDVHALDERSHRGRRLDGVPTRRAVVADDRRHPATGLEGVEELGPLRRARTQQERAQEVVELVGGGGRRLDLRPDPIDGLLGDPAHLAGSPAGGPAAAARRASAGRWPHRRRGTRTGAALRISWASRDGSVESTKWKRTSPASTRRHSSMSPSQSSASVRQSCTAWRGSGVVGHLDGAGDVLLARGGAGEHDGEQVVALHPLERRRHLPPAAEAQHDEAPVQVPPPAALEDRLVEDGLLQRGPDRARGEEAGHVGEREAVVRPEGDDDRHRRWRSPGARS